MNLKIVQIKELDKNTVAEKAQNLKITSNSNKDDNSRRTPSCWKSLPKCIITMTDFLEKTKSYKNFIKEDGLVVDPRKLQKFEKKIVSHFVVDKRSCNICCSTKHRYQIRNVPWGKNSTNH